MSYLYLGLAVIFEVIGTLLLLPVSQNFSRLWPTLGIVGAYGVAFYCLTFALRDIPIAIVYASWAGLGVFLVATFSHFVFKLALPWQAIVGLVLIVVGVVLVNAFSGVQSKEKLNKPKRAKTPWPTQKSTMQPK